MEGFVIQNTNRSVATAGMLAHGVASNEYGTDTLHWPVPHELAAAMQSDGVVQGGSAGMNLLTCTVVNSLACVFRQGALYINTLLHNPNDDFNAREHCL